MARVLAPNQASVQSKLPLTLDPARFDLTELLGDVLPLQALADPDGGGHLLRLALPGDGTGLLLAFRFRFQWASPRDSLCEGKYWGAFMGKPHPVVLRERVVAFVEEGNSHRSTAAHFRVSVKFVNGMVILKRETGSLEPLAQGNGGGHGKMTAIAGWLTKRMRQKPDLTLDDLVVELASDHGVISHRVSAWRAPRRFGLTHKKSPSRRRA